MTFPDPARRRLRVTPAGVPARLVALVAVALLATSCTGSSGDPTAESSPGSPQSTQSSPTTPPPPPPPAPKTGECRRLTFADISRYSDSTEPVPCDKGHTAYTFAVTRLPTDVAVEGVDLGNRAIQDAAAEGCRDAYTEFIGGDAATRARSRLTVTYFLPPQQGYDRGADWVRCDVVALRTPEDLAPLPTALRGFLDDDAALDDYGVCSVGAPGTKDFELVMCAHRHSYRAVAALRLGANDEAYPGRDVTLVQGRQRCEKLVADELGVSGGYTFGWTFPTPADWDDGQRFGFCWTQTSS